MNMYTFIFLFNIVNILIHLLCENDMYVTVANAHIQQSNVNEFDDSLLHIWLCIFFYIQNTSMKVLKILIELIFANN